MHFCSDCFNASHRFWDDNIPIGNVVEVGLTGNVIDPAKITTMDQLWWANEFQISS